MPGDVVLLEDRSYQLFFHAITDYGSVLNGPDPDPTLEKIGFESGSNLKKNPLMQYI